MAAQANVVRQVPAFILTGTPLPGGQLLSGMGGSVYVCQSACDPETTSGYTLDVSQWVGQRIYLETECPHSGAFGAILRRRVAFDFAAQLEIAYDVGNPPEVLLQNNNTVGIQLIIGDPTAYANLAVAKRIVCPSALLTVAQTITPSKGTDVVRHLCTLKGNARSFLLPDEAALYDAYITTLRTVGHLV